MDPILGITDDQMRQKGVMFIIQCMSIKSERVHQMLSDRRDDINTYTINPRENHLMAHNFRLVVNAGTELYNRNVREISVCCPPDAATSLEIMAFPECAHPLSRNPWRCSTIDELITELQALANRVAEDEDSDCY